MRLFIMFSCCAVIFSAMFFSVNKNLTEIDKAAEEYWQKLEAEKKQEVEFEEWKQSDTDPEKVKLTSDCQKTIARKENKKIKTPKIFWEEVYNANLQSEIDYCQRLIDAVGEKNPTSNY